MGGVNVDPEATSWSWGLELQRCGFTGAERPVAAPGSTDVDGQRLTYIRESGLEEWYVNDGRGLEHGYTVRSRPNQERDRGEALLVFELAVSGELTAEVESSGRSVRFLDADGRTMLRYSGLYAFDADGRELEADIELRDDRLRLQIDVHDARYPLTIDPIVGPDYLKASNAEANDNFGCSVAISGDTIVVGVPREASSATGVDGDQSDHSLLAAGAAYLFSKDGTWSQIAYLKPSNTTGNQMFGETVAIEGHTVIIGSELEDGGSTGVNGDPFDLSAPNSGAAYTYVVTDLFPRYCFGDPGSGTPCPCSDDNDGSVPESGCANGVFASGAQLGGWGDASVSAGTVVLFATHAEPLELGLYFQGDDRLNGGDGVIFGDGLRCAGGNVIRLEVRVADALGNSSTSVGLAAKGGVVPGDVKRYQFWYRNPSGSPCGSTFNLSNGTEVIWDI